MQFGPHVVPLDNVIYQTKYTYVFSNLRPLCKGHILVTPIRCVPFLHDLTHEEMVDFTKVCQFAGQTMKKHLHAQRLNLTIQDGVEAGQTVPHVHCHVVPINESTQFIRQYPDDQTRIESTNLFKSYFQLELHK